ncbi:MAG: flagellar hook-associated protein FlgK [Proteobacteria bacterium]|nr:flagellar hook-associated protein FlgK [Pseudomonadota bacterium]
MSSSALMSTGLRAMFAATAQLNTTAHNIANVNTTGYSRQGVLLATAEGQFSGGGFFGKGVDVVNVRRAHDQFLTMQNMAAQSLSAMDTERAGQLKQLEAVFPPGANGLGYRMGEFFAAMTALANAPADSSARQVVLSRAADTASQFAYAGQRLDELQAGIHTDLTNSAASVNTLADGIAKLNQQIAVAAGLNQTPNDLLDQRDQLIAQLSEFVQVSTVAASDGTLGVFIGGGQRLVLGNEASTLQVVSAQPDTTQSQLMLTTGNQSINLGPELLTGGSMTGMLRYQNEDLVAARNQLGQMAAAFAEQVNKAQSLGLDLRVPPGSGTALFGFTATVAGQPAAQNARGPGGQALTTATTTIVDGSLLQASNYELRLDTSGSGKTYELTRLPDGSKFYLDDGESVEGFRVDMGGAPLQAGEMLLLRPVALAASSMRRALDDPNGIAAALPATATLGTANTGTATVGSLTMTGNPAYDPNVTVNISFTSNTGDYTLELRDATTNALIGAPINATWTPGQPIVANGVALNLNGAPAQGDTMTVAKTQFPASNNGNALNMAAMATAPLVGRYLDGAGQPAGGASVTDAYAATMAQVGVRAQAAQTASRISTTAAEDATNQLSSATGVNLDEEAARLIQYQQAYQAAAKVLQTAQTVLDTVLQIAR